ncbi:ABC transporter ATP-binding protein [Roseburia sp. 499]|uniref:ABC transporter ATP-binding protein n=1 Tax=Roseburia sp. 499 TaxID=1261634 RepID=UPI00095140E4|nr:ABC transporter ATP-binding protein [Roseburia sp. 499]WVK70699.1 ABC transporter ATP-binding protein [Roseburia sp. 499]
MKKTIIETRDLCKSFVVGKNANNVLKNINLSIYEGDFTIIMGSSGSGKSTLLYSLSTMDKPTSGSVMLYGEDIAKINEKRAARIRKEKVSFVFQSMNLLSDLNVFENIAYCGYGTAEKEKINQKTRQLLERMGLADMAEKYPSEISGGMKQRVAIARALISGAGVIFGDEPTGALNSSMGKQVLDLLTELNEEGQSIVMVTHDLKAAARATRLLYLEDGRIVGDLNLGHYTEETRKERENTVYTFLKEHNW